MVVLPEKAPLEPIALIVPARWMGALLDNGQHWYLEQPGDGMQRYRTPPRYLTDGARTVRVSSARVSRPPGPTLVEFRVIERIT